MIPNPAIAPNEGGSPGATFSKPIQITITLHAGFMGIKGHMTKYTIDGSDPTETNGLTYTGPFILDQAATLKVRNFKQNSFPSRTIMANFFASKTRVKTLRDAPVFTQADPFATGVRQIKGAAGIIISSKTTYDTPPVYGLDFWRVQFDDGKIGWVPNSFLIKE